MLLEGAIMSKQDIVSEYIKFVTKYKRYPTRVELKEYAEISRDQVRDAFGNYENLKKEAFSKGLEDVILDVEQLGHKYAKKTIKNLAGYKRFVITTAVVNSEVNARYLDSIRTYCKHEDAALIIIPSLQKGNGAKWTIDPSLKSEHIVFFDLALNSNIKILGVANNSKSIDPTTGLPRLGKRNGSIICASPKQNLKIVATGINKLPHALMSTGAITNPEYFTNSPMRAKQDYLAENDHVLGALIVELDKDGLFHYRQTQADSSFGFTDLGHYYHKGKKVPFSPEVLIPGDYHSGNTDPEVESALFDMTKKLDIKEWILHDAFDGESVNHHLQNKNIALAKLARFNKLSLHRELQNFCSDLGRIKEHTKRVTIVASNHDQFLDRYLEEARYVDDHENKGLALELALAKYRGMSPLKYYVENYSKVKNVRWLELDESYKIADIECGMHGHIGSNGAKGSPKSMEDAYGSVIYGHTHTPNILRNAWCVGTSTFLQLSYNKGASSWLNTSAIVYSNGVRQLINKIDGSWTTRKL